MDLGTTYTGVAATWIVPPVVASGTNEFSATWIGIDGADNSDLIQTGTTQATIDGGTAYDAWWEILPAAQSPIDEPVYPDDEMKAEINEDSPGIWTIAIEDVTEDWLASGEVDYDGPADSAEWIEEAPTVDGEQATLADFGLAGFTDLEISDDDNSDPVLDPAYMVSDSGAVLAYPGTFDATTDSFSILYGSPPPPTVTGISPTQGPTSGGTTVTISFFGGVEPSSILSVQFGSEPGTIVDDADAGSSAWMTATDPAEQAGTVNVTVTILGGTSATSSADEFTYVAPPPPPSPPPPSPSPSPSPASSGYDLVGSDGGVFVFPTGQSGGFYGSLPGDNVHVNDIVGMVPTPSDQGYFLVGADGGVFSFGNAPFLGSLPGLGVSVDDIKGIVPTSDNGGYFLVGADGGVFAFGDAPYLGSLPGSGVHTNTVVGIAALPSDQGYWLVTSNGTVYAFGAHNYGSVSGADSPITGIDSTPDGNGYWVVAQNGSVYAFGDAGYYGSLPQSGITPAKPVIGLVPTADDQGYWLIGSDGGIFAYGDAPFVGSLPGLGISVSDIVGAVPTKV